MIGKIMVSVGLSRHPKLHALAKAAGIGWAAALGHLAAMWSEVMVQREGGVLAGWSKEDVERAAGWAGKRGTLSQALVKTGWLDVSRGGKLSIHDWDGNQGDIIEERRHEAVRKRVYRAHKKGFHTTHCAKDCPGILPKDTNGTVPGTSTPPSPSLPVPSLPIPARPLPDAGRAPLVAAPGTPEEDREVDRTVGAFGFCATPGIDAKRAAVQDLRRLGLSHEYIRVFAGKHPTDPFYDIVRRLEKGRPAKAKPKTCRRCAGLGKVQNPVAPIGITDLISCPECAPPAPAAATG